MPIAMEDGTLQSAIEVRQAPLDVSFPSLSRIDGLCGAKGLQGNLLNKAVQHEELSKTLQSEVVAKILDWRVDQGNKCKVYCGMVTQLQKDLRSPQVLHSSVAPQS
jgi:hypothetical protein